MTATVQCRSGTARFSTARDDPIEAGLAGDHGGDDDVVIGQRAERRVQLARALNPCPGT
ncbi:hypothetical protein [Mycobacterium shinjukuense]|uniref:hypothetical protein n=1 Tax=Mycobacterium shinjukuense TaxID=398694 RepID=UPI003100DB6E